MAPLKFSVPCYYPTPMTTPSSPVAPGGAPDKHSAVRAMFGRIAGRYDLMNRLMSFGLDGRWRGVAVAAAELPAGGVALDVGTGTGDLAIQLARSAPGAHVVGLDYTGPMLALAPAKAQAAAVGGQLSWVRADGQTLPFVSGTFNAVTSAFVLRNFGDLDAALGEMARVLAPGGRFVALEISPDGLPIWRHLFAWSFRVLIPRLGRLVTGEAEAYRYLPASVAAFLTPDQVALHLAARGLDTLPPRRLFGGAMVVHRAVRPL